MLKRWNFLKTGFYEGINTAHRGIEYSKRTCITLSLSTGWELRYLDDRQMGIVYYVRAKQLGQVPRLSEQGPDVLDEFSFEEFQQRLRLFHGEIKGILTRGRVIAGIGNAYADEVLFAAEVYPFRKRKALSSEELRRIYDKSREVVKEASQCSRSGWGRTSTSRYATSSRCTTRAGSPAPDVRIQSAR